MPDMTMPKIYAIPAIRYVTTAPENISAFIAPPYDVLDEQSKKHLQSQNPHNIVTIDLPHLPPKTVGPDATYQQAGATYRTWLEQGILERVQSRSYFVYRQTFSIAEQTFQRLGLIANLLVKPLGTSEQDSSCAIFPHEQTFSAPKEDRLKLTRETRAQLSPIFGLYSDCDGQVGDLINRISNRSSAALWGRTANDGVMHELWAAPDDTDAVASIWADRDVFIADGHHRYNTALNYQHEQMAANGTISDSHPANFCMFVLVAMQDPGMTIMPTHRVLGGMKHFTMDSFTAAAAEYLIVEPFAGNNLADLEVALAQAGPHAIGLYHVNAAGRSLAIATTLRPDPLDQIYPQRSKAWRNLDTAIVRHLLVEEICQPNFCEKDREVHWGFPHTLDQIQSLTDGQNFQLGVVMQATTLEAVRLVSTASELMPPKSTFFYPKVATGLVINPLE